MVNAAKSGDDAVDPAGGHEKLEHGRSDQKDEEPVVTIGRAVADRDRVARRLFGPRRVRPRIQAPAVGIDLRETRKDCKNCVVRVVGGWLSTFRSSIVSTERHPLWQAEK